MFLFLKSSFELRMHCRNFERIFSSLMKVYCPWICVSTKLERYELIKVLGQNHSVFQNDRYIINTKGTKLIDLAEIKLTVYQTL